MEDLVTAELAALETLVGGAALDDDTKARSVRCLERLAASYRQFQATFEEPTRLDILHAEQLALRLLAPDRVAAVTAQERFEALRQQCGILGAGRRAA